MTNRHKVIKSEKQSGFFGPPCIYIQVIHNKYQLSRMNTSDGIML